jgi:hypothetical protein
MSDFYDADILEWSERQADLLRRVAAGERLSDWPNIIEEVESVGRDQLHAVRSLLMQALLHMLKAEAWPNARLAPEWRAEAIRFRSEAASRFSPSMRQHIDAAKLYASARRIMQETMDGQPPLPLTESYPMTLAELLDEDGDC